LRWEASAREVAEAEVPIKENLRVALAASTAEAGAINSKAPEAFGEAQFG
jgi:hypothetical protein